MHFRSYTILDQMRCFYQLTVISLRVWPWCMHPSYLRSGCIRRKKKRVNQTNILFLNETIMQKWIKGPKEGALYHFTLIIFLWTLNGKFNWHGRNGIGPMNVSIVEVMTPMWNVSWTGRVNPCFVWGCARSFSRTIMPCNCV